MKPILNSIIENPIPFLALIVASISSIIAFSSRRVAKKAMTIVSKTYADKQSNFDIYLIEGYRWHRDSIPSILLFNISINNKSDTKNTLQATLEIEYLKNDGESIIAMVPHDPLLKDDLKSKSNITPFASQIRLEEKHTESSWLLFKQPGDPFSKYKIIKYTLKVVDNKENLEVVDTYILKSLK